MSEIENNKPDVVVMDLDLYHYKNEPGKNYHENTKNRKHEKDNIISCFRDYL